MRILDVMTNTETVFHFRAPEDWEIKIDVSEGLLQIIQARPIPDRGYIELARFNSGHWAWYRWQEVTEPSDD